LIYFRNVRLTSVWSASSSIAIGVEQTIKVGFADFFDSESKFSETTTFTNEKGSTSTATHNQQSTVSEQVTCDGPADVVITVDLNSCDAKGTATVPMVATGYVWFRYGSKRNDHYYWAVPIDNSDAAHRTSNMDLDVTGSGKSFGTFNSA
jgi:hypothetical protein